MIRALVLDEDADGVRAAVQEIDDGRLPDLDTTVEVLFSSLNYKDGLAVTGRGKIVRGAYPFVPGIDLVGRVLDTTSNQFEEGDLVIGTGWGLGERHWGGYAERQRVQADWLVPLPGGLAPEAAMTAGTAGLTAMLAIMELEGRGIRPDDGAVLVTGASGGVGSVAVGLLSAQGYEVTASTGSDDTHEYLRELGARRILHRDELGAGAARPLDSAAWAGAVDVVGGRTLEAVLSRVERHGAVAACGLAGGHDLNTTVFPFILRGVSLIGIDSNTCPNGVRSVAWQRLAALRTQPLLERIASDRIPLDAIPEYSSRILSGGIRGRVVVDLGG